MSYSNGDLLSDVRDIGSLPSPSNDGFVYDIHCLLWFKLMELVIWKVNPKCLCFDGWAQEISFKFKEYAKAKWKGSYKSFLSAHKAWLATPIKFPDASECVCRDHLDESGIGDMDQVNSSIKIICSLGISCMSHIFGLSLHTNLISFSPASPKIFLK